MNPLFRISLSSAAVFVILKMILFQTGKHEDLYMLVVFGNILLLLTSMAGGLYFLRKSQKKESTYADDVKATMKSAAVYIILCSSFAYLYYTKIDTASVEQRIKTRVDQAESVSFEELQLKHPEQLKDKTRHDFIDDEKRFAEMIFSPFFMTTVMLVSGLFLAFFYSLVLAWFWRKYMDKISG